MAQVRLGSMWDRGELPLILGHRGASSKAPENTIQAFAAAIEDGADGIELDVRLCASGDVVVFHDETLERLLGQKDRVDSLPWSSLAELRVDGQSIPLLSEVLSAMGERVCINIELKTHSPCLVSRLVQAVASVVCGHNSTGNLLLSSFDPILLRLAMMATRLPGAQLIAPDSSGIQSAAAHLTDAVHPHHSMIREIVRWRARDKRVHVWTVDEPDDLQKMAELGVGAVISNDPGAARKVLTSRCYSSVHPT